MKKLMAPAVIVILFLTFAGFMARMIYYGQPPRPAARISVVVYGENDERWRSLDQGVSQACSELGIEKPVITAVRGENAALQTDQLRREITGGAEGLLVAALSSAALEEYLGAVPPEIPVVAVETGAGTLPFVGVDDADMGRALADCVAAEEGQVGLLAEGLARDSVSRRYEAFCSRMAELGREVVPLSRDDLRSFVDAGLTSEPGARCLVALDNDSLEQATDLLTAGTTDVALFGVGSSDKVLHAIDSGTIRTVAFPNEYAIGYIGVLQLAEQMGVAKAPDSVAVQYSMVSRENMYAPEIERLLFPIIQ